MKVLSKSEIRFFLSRQNSKVSRSTIIQLAQLIRCDGLIRTFNYYGEKHNISVILKNFIIEKYGKKVWYSFINKCNPVQEDKKKQHSVKEESLSNAYYMEITRNVINLALEWKFFIPKDYREVNSGKRNIEKIKGKICEEIKMPDEIKKSQSDINQYFKKRGYCCEAIYAEGIDKMVIGIGNASVSEVSMTLHHLYKVPYIPSTAIKGAFFRYCEILEEEISAQYPDWKKVWFGINADREESELREENELKEENKVILRGNVIYMDTYIKSGELVGDIMTPHFTEYYREKGKTQYAVDSETINPIAFKAVKEAKCNFHIYFKQGMGSKDLFLKYFKDSFEIVSIGAKASAGYGYFKVVEKNDSKE